MHQISLYHFTWFVFSFAVYQMAQKSSILTADMLLDVKHVRRKNLLSYLPSDVAEQIRATSATMRKTVGGNSLLQNHGTNK